MMSAKNVYQFPKGKGKRSPVARKPSNPRKIQWSPDRPNKPAVDPMLDDLIRQMRMDKRSYFAKANVSGLSITCIKNIEEGVTRRPQGVTIWMLYKYLGYTAPQW